MDKKLLSASGRHLQDRHLLPSNIPAEIKIREHDNPGSNDHYQAGPMQDRTDYMSTLRALTSLE